jgi:hypothetical protein
MSAQLFPLLVLLGCSQELDPTLAAAPKGGAGAEPDAGSACRELSLSGRTFLACVGPPATFTEAERECERLGGTLARIASEAENTALSLQASDVGAQSNLWLGGRRDDEHVWSWPNAEIFWTGLADGVAPPNVYTNWQPGEPNNHSTVLDEPEECTALTLFDATWKDRACSLQLSYFCERPQGG